MATVMDAEFAARWARNMSRADLIGVCHNMMFGGVRGEDYLIRITALRAEVYRRGIRL